MLSSQRAIELRGREMPSPILVSIANKRPRIDCLRAHPFAATLGVARLPCPFVAPLRVGPESRATLQETNG